MCSLARSNAPKATVVQESMYDFIERAPDMSFDGAVAFMSLIVIPKSEVSRVLRGILRILKPGAVLAISTVAIDVDFAPYKFMGQDVRGSGFTVEGLRAALEEVGFEVTRTAFDSFVPNGDRAEPEPHAYCFCKRKEVSIVVKPVGFVRSEYSDPTPPAEKLDFSDRRSIVEILPEFRPALMGLDAYASARIIFHFHRSTEDTKLQAAPHGGPMRGVFATCCPGRPNHIGITSAEVLSVDVAQGLLVVKGLDAVDGSPVLDVKPGRKK